MVGPRHVARRGAARRRARPRRSCSASPIDIGTLEKGKDADIVAVPGDPLKDIHATEKVLFVMKGGSVFKQAARPE